MSFYEMEICGLKRQLPICEINENLSIAGFVIYGDTELTMATAKALFEKSAEADIYITAEAKGIPLVYELSRISGKPYIVCNKKKKAYMSEPISVTLNSITTEGEQKLWIDKVTGESMKGKKVAIVDDVISTGESVAALEKIVNCFEPAEIQRLCILAEGDAANRDDIVFLEKLPLFFK